MIVRIKKLNENAVIPTYAHPTDAGLDLTAISKNIDDDGNIVYGTGLAFEIPEGYVGLLFPRSSNSKKDLWLTNFVGIIDAGYRGEVKLKFRRSIFHFSLLNRIRMMLGMRFSISQFNMREYEIGDRIGQLIIMPYPKIELQESDWLSVTDRGENGYGSTGK